MDMTPMQFSIPLWAELCAVVVGALHGALFAGASPHRRIDVLGAVLIGLGLALGGSMLRDVLLGVPPAVIRSEWHILVAATAGLLGVSLRQVFARFAAVHVTLDALTLGLFGAVGASKAMAVGVPAIPAAFVGAAAAVGGSVLRDVALNLPIAVLHVGSLYAVAAAAGSASIVLLASLGAPMLGAAITGVVITATVRLLAIALDWAIPEQHELFMRRRSIRLSR